VCRVLSYEHNEVSTGWSKNSFVESEPEHSAIFIDRFLRSHRLLYFIACRVLGGDEKALIAIRNCWRTALCSPPHFEYEGAFRSWLVRILIDEALAILRENKGNVGAAVVNGVSLSDSVVNPGLE
jgi:DNA-directed RNA polymerase specialized sigma24 family protein